MNKKLLISSLPTAVQDMIRALEAHPDVTRLSAHEGQILIYPGHHVPGVFLVLSGVVTIEPPESAKNVRPLRRDATQGPFLMPGPADIDAIARGRVRFDHPAELVFIPRSLVQDNEEIRHLLSASRLSTVAVA
ncbi:MAG: hypothetical protein U0V87_04325 [Acidobacteriota bacterium]